jgi:hypothetical protein
VSCHAWRLSLASEEYTLLYAARYFSKVALCAAALVVWLVLFVVLLVVVQPATDSDATITIAMMANSFFSIQVPSLDEKINQKGKTAVW